MVAGGCAGKISASRYGEVDDVLKGVSSPRVNTRTQAKNIRFSEAY